MLFYNTTVDGLQMGLCFAVLALGLYISYTILDFSDLSVDGTFPLGGVVCTIFMYRLGIPALLAVVLSFFAGAAMGAVTGILHVKFRISKLLSGIIVMTGLMSVNLALTQLLTDDGYATSIFSYRSKKLAGLFDGEWVEIFGKGGEDYIILLTLLAFVIVIKLLLDLFLRTKAGYMLRATGDNEMLVTALGQDVGVYKLLGLSLANGLVAVSGALYANLYSQYDNSSGSGKVVLALASVIIGMALFGGIKRVRGTTASIIGAVIYSLCLNYLVLVDSGGIYLKLMNAVLFALILVFNDRIMGLTRRKNVKLSLQNTDIPETFAGEREGKNG